MLKYHNVSVKICLTIFILLLLCCQASAFENFKVAVYSRAYETRQMADLNRLRQWWENISNQVHIDKIYLETYRDTGILVDGETLEIAKKFFNDRGVETAGGITYTLSELNRFQTFCYSNPVQRKTVQQIAEFTAKYFDEFILDDFFFTNCKCEYCIAGKGDKSWTQYRLELMADAAQNLVVGPAKKVNPNVKVIIKYPNWYDHFQGLGFNLEKEPAIFDGLYTGTETRDPSSSQHLQQYLGYLIFRYFDNIKPGANMGGWVDTGSANPLDRYAEQLWLTLFAKAPEITLFNTQQIQMNLRGYNSSWAGQGTSFDYNEMIQPIELPDGTTMRRNTYAGAAGYTFDKVDKFLGKLGNPIGVKSYKPFHSSGEDFLQDYFGMIGIPMDIVPEFPTDANMIFLTQQAAADPDIVEKIKGQLMQGKSVTITSGFLHAMQGKGIENIAELQYTDRKAIVRDFGGGGFGGMRGGGANQATDDIVIPQIVYYTNDSWEELAARDGTSGWPMIISSSYANGTMYTFTIPEDFIDLYNLPSSVLSRFRSYLTSGMPVSIDAPGMVSLFVYDNDTCIVESFRDEPVDVTVTAAKQVSGLRDLQTDELIGSGGGRGGMRRGSAGGMGGFRGSGGRRSSGIARTSFNVKIKPHSYRVFKYE